MKVVVTGICIVSAKAFNSSEAPDVMTPPPI